MMDGGQQNGRHVPGITPALIEGIQDLVPHHVWEKHIDKDYINVVFTKRLYSFFPGMGCQGPVTIPAQDTLYQLSEFLLFHHYEDDRYVAASLELFASVALMFWYVLQLKMSFMGSD